MRIVFLDIDGVLNSYSTKEKYNGFIGIDSALVKNLAEFINLSNQEEETNIVLSSSWRLGQDRNGDYIPDSYQYVVDKLAEFELSIFDDTPRLKWNNNFGDHRGREITAWFYQNRDINISGYVVLDDVCFKDFKKYEITPHLVQTSLLYNGGFQEKYIKQALEIIKIPIKKNNKQKNIKIFKIGDVEIQAESHEEAFEMLYSGMVYKEVSKDDFYDIKVVGDDTTKYFWIRSG